MCRIDAYRNIYSSRFFSLNNNNNNNRNVHITLLVFLDIWSVGFLVESWYPRKKKNKKIREYNYIYNMKYLLMKLSSSKRKSYTRSIHNYIVLESKIKQNIIIQSFFSLHSLGHTLPKVFRLFFFFIIVIRFIFFRKSCNRYGHGGIESQPSVSVTVPCLPLALFL